MKKCAGIKFVNVQANKILPKGYSQKLQHDFLTFLEFFSNIWYLFATHSADRSLSILIRRKICIRFSIMKMYFPYEYFSMQNRKFLTNFPPIINRKRESYWQIYPAYLYTWLGFAIYYFISGETSWIYHLVILNLYLNSLKFNYKT